jgi:5,6-dimethylbenzimidazole synthase
MPQTRLHSVMLAIHTLWLAARARGLALGWVSILDPAFVARTLAVPDDWTFAALLCLGYPEAVADTPELDRLGWQARLDPLAQISER